MAFTRLRPGLALATRGPEGENPIRVRHSPSFLFPLPLRPYTIEPFPSPLGKGGTRPGGGLNPDFGFRPPGRGGTRPSPGWPPPDGGRAGPGRAEPWPRSGPLERPPCTQRSWRRPWSTRRPPRSGSHTARPGARSGGPAGQKSSGEVSASQTSATDKHL